MPAFAGGVGNSVFGCYGEWYNTDWDQKCFTGGARQTGFYKTTANCNDQPDKSKTVARNRGNGVTVDGPDCSFLAQGAKTVFFQ